jgi:hypothetical protein
MASWSSLERVPPSAVMFRTLEMILWTSCEATSKERKEKKRNKNIYNIPKC